LEDNRTIEFEEADAARYVYGQRDSYLRLVEKALDIEVAARGNQLTLIGPDDALETAQRVFRQLYGRALKGYSISPADVTRAVSILRREPETELA